MTEDKNKVEKNLLIENPFAVKCPACGLYSSVVLDPKKISDEKTIRLCLVCGHLFEYFNQPQNINLR